MTLAFDNWNESMHDENETTTISTIPSRPSFQIFLYASSDLDYSTRILENILNEHVYFFLQHALDVRAHGSMAHAAENRKG